LLGDYNLQQQFERIISALQHSVDPYKLEVESQSLYQINLVKMGQESHGLNIM